MKSSSTRSPLAKQAARLQALGLTAYEAVAYLILLQHHPATAYEIGKLGGLVKANVYPTLESLVRRGAVQPVSREPTRYVPVDPQSFLSSVAQGTATLCNELVAELGEVTPDDPVEYVWLLQSAADIQARIAQMIAQARKHIWLKGPENLLLPHRTALREAVKRGTKLVVILFGNESAAKRFRFSQNARVYLHEGSGMIVGAGESQVIVACDFGQALSANIAEHCEGAFTRNPSVVYLAESLIRHEIYLAEIISAYAPRIEADFGKALVSLRRHYLPERYVEDLRARLAVRL
ncbi:MAG: TrmB family transcriptional regulator [Burkholderiales bacterium]|nr:TrmB family transcriptional regulator [Burkholderiales bacterium]